MQYSKKDILIATLMTLVIIILCVGAVGLGFSVVNRMTALPPATATADPVNQSQADQSQQTVQAEAGGNLADTTPTGLEGSTSNTSQEGAGTFSLSLGEMVICVVMVAVMIFGVILLDRFTRRRAGTGIQ
jgi:hypothetical protein